MNEEEKNAIVNDLNTKIGGVIQYLNNAYDLQNELTLKKYEFENKLSLVNNEVPAKLPSVIEKAKNATTQIEELKEKSDIFKKKVEFFFSRIEPLKKELDKRFAAINKLEGVLAYLQSYEKIEQISQQLKHCKEDDKAVELYVELKEMYSKNDKGHRGNYIREYALYWHHILKDKLSRQYDDILKQLKWPLTTAAVENSTPLKDKLLKFNNLTRFLFLIEAPGVNAINSEKTLEGSESCLPVKLLLLPLKKRFAFHFCGSRQTARIDRPEWFFTQTLTWIKDHQSFLNQHVQPIAEQLQLKKVKVIDEFNAGLISLAAERLHTVLGLYQIQGEKDSAMDVNAAFAHAVDETLSFHRELTILTGKDVNEVLSVLTKAEIFVRWLAVEKKYALAKMDETLGDEQWSEAVAEGLGSAVGTVVWVPRGADWFISLLKTIEDRYAVLPQPGHRLQFLELQLELIEEWRVRLTQLMNAALETLHTESFMSTSNLPLPLTAVINAAHHTRSVLLQWAHSLHYLQLHFYRSQFQHFTQQQHRDEDIDIFSNASGNNNYEEYNEKEITRPNSKVHDKDDTISLEDVETIARKLALSEISRQSSATPDFSPCEVVLCPRHVVKPRATHEWVGALLSITRPGCNNKSAKLGTNPEESQQNMQNTSSGSRILPIGKEGSAAPSVNLALMESLDVRVETEESGVFVEAPLLLAHLRDAGLEALAQHLFLEFKAGMRDYKKQKWHAMVTVEEQALLVSPALCRPLGALCTRLSVLSTRLAPCLSAGLRTRLALDVDQYLFQEVVMESWFNTGGTIQFTHDVKRNIIPAFAPPDKPNAMLAQFPRLLEASILLNLDYEDARRLRSILSKHPSSGDEELLSVDIKHIQPDEALQILNQRTDLSDPEVTYSSVMDLF